MEKSRKEHYRRALPHYQQPGQAYFLTVMLADAIPVKALENYSKRLTILSENLEYLQSIPERNDEFQKLKKEQYFLRQKYRKAYDDLLDVQQNSSVNLSKSKIISLLSTSLLFWESKRIENFAFCIMNNHFHWVFRTFEKDFEDKPVYLQDIMHSIKSFTANEINALEHRSGQLWHVEDFDTTIRNDRHLFNSIQYTINNPVKANLVNNWYDWKGTWLSEEWMDVFGSVGFGSVGFQPT